MKFNDYPLKDELGEGLHIYERTTGRSAHLLVESLIEKYLIKSGILGSDEDEIVEFPFDLIPSEKEVTPVNKNNFKKVRGGAGYCHITYEELDFGYHKTNSHEGISPDELIEELAKLPYPKLLDLSKNTVGNIPHYPSFLRKKLENPTYSVKEHEDFLRKPKILATPSRGKQQIRIGKFSLGTYENEDEINEIIACLSDMDDSEIDELIQILRNSKGKRRKGTLKYIRDYKRK